LLVQVAQELLRTGVNNTTLHVEQVRPLDFPGEGWRLRFGTCGAWINSVTLGAIGLCVCAVLHNAAAGGPVSEEVNRALGSLPVFCSRRGKPAEARARCLEAMQATTVAARRNRKLDLLMMTSLFKKLLWLAGTE
jgi:hypothetical protein